MKQTKSKIKNNAAERVLNKLERKIQTNFSNIKVSKRTIIFHRKSSFRLDLKMSNSEKAKITLQAKITRKMCKNWEICMSKSKIWKIDQNLQPKV